MTRSMPRRAFTLIELLVVTGLLAAFLGLVVGGLRPSNGSQLRQLSQTISSAILAARSRALGNDVGAAIILDVTSGAVSTNTIFNADVPPFITGVVVSGMPPTSLSATSAVVSLTPDNADPADLAQGYKIRFSATSPYLPPTPWLGFSNSTTVSLRSDANQTINNTTWPNPVGTLRFHVARFPVKSTSAIDTTRLAAVDLRYSGIGNTITGDYGSLSGKGSIAIVFDRSGGLDSVMQYGSAASPTVAPTVPTSPLYLLIASVSDIQNNTSLQSQSSRWIVIAPNTGRVNIAANVTVAGSAEADVMAARANARQGVTGGVK